MTAPRKRRTAAVINQIHAASSLDDLSIELDDAIRAMFDAEQLALYAVDRTRRELYCNYVKDTVEGPREHRVPITPDSVPGYCAKTGRSVVLVDASDAEALAAISPELRIDYPMGPVRQLLAVPIIYGRKHLMGVLMLLNKRSGEPFDERDSEFASEIAETLGIALHNHARLTAKDAGTRFDYLVEHNLLTRDELRDAIARAREAKRDVASVLIDAYFVSKQEVGNSLAMFYGVPFVAFDPKRQIDRTLLKDINLEFLKSNYCVPLGSEGETVEVLLDNPSDEQRLENIRLALGGRPIRPFVGLRKDILRFIANSIDASSGVMDDTFLNILGELVEAIVEPDADEHEAAEDDGAIVRLANQIIINGFKRGASDIHVEPCGGRKPTRVRFRIDGTCHHYQDVPPAHRRALVSRLKIMSQLDISERRKPQDGKIRFRLPTGRDVELRVATVPTAGGNEDVVMRILSASEPLPLDRLAMTARNLAAFQSVIERPHGLLLVVGPTGSGKTTTLHAALGAINQPGRKIWTAEDPVEITQDGLRQVQVQPRIGFDFAAALRSFLRADPDVIMVGEMRDHETARTAVEASLTGHLVLSTLHTNSAAETVTRLLDMGLEPFNFADALLGVLAQRLVRTLCAACAEEVTPDPAAWETLRQAYGAEPFDALSLNREKTRIKRARGCEECHQIGYRGRLGIHELMLATPEIAALILARAGNAAIKSQAVRDGMTTMRQDGVLKVLVGRTDWQQLKAVSG